MRGLKFVPTIHKIRINRITADELYERIGVKRTGYHMRAHAALGRPRGPERNAAAASAPHSMGSEFPANWGHTYDLRPFPRAMAFSGGLVGFVALWCYAEECAFSLSTQAQDHVWDLAEYKRVEPAHCPTARRPMGQAASEIFCGHTTLFVCTRA
jgi:hypothetical protein